MTIGAGDPLSGHDGTGGGADPGVPDGIGALPGMGLPAVRLPSIGPDGGVTGLDEMDADLAGPDGPARPSTPPTTTGPVPGVAPPAVPERAAGPDRAPAPIIRAGVIGGRSVAASTAPAAGPPRAGFVPRPAARPRIEEEPGILGFSRRSHSRIGSRLFTWFFVFVFTLILVQLIVALLDP